MPALVKNSLANEFSRMPFRVGLATLQIPQIAALATSPWPAWLWSTDATRRSVDQRRRGGDFWRGERGGVQQRAF